MAHGTSLPAVQIVDAFGRPIATPPQNGALTLATSNPESRRLLEGILTELQSINGLTLAAPSGSAVAGEVAFWKTASALSGDSKLTWNNTLGRLTISGSAMVTTNARIGDSTTPTDTLELTGTLRVRDTAFTIPASTGAIDIIAQRGAVTFGGSSGLFNGCSFIGIDIGQLAGIGATRSIWTMSAASTGTFGNQILALRVAPDVRIASGVANTWNLFNNNVQIRSDTTNATVTVAAILNDSPTFGLLNGATALTVTDYRTVSSQPALVAGVTMTLRRGFFYQDQATASAGAQPTTIALDVTDQTSSGAFTEAAAVRSAITSAAGKFFLHDTGGATSQIKGSVVVGADTAVSNAFVALEVQSTTQAFLLPRMTTTQRDAMTPLDGMLIYNTTLASTQVRKPGVWVSF